ncbi:hypothetical protein BD310DRAFT_932913, partial [Dichomitus squalens]
ARAMLHSDVRVDATVDQVDRYSKPVDMSTRPTVNFRTLTCLSTTFGDPAAPTTLFPYVSA